MNPVFPGGLKSFGDDFGGEIEIEKIPYLEIEIKRKDLLPVFEQFHKVKPDWNGRCGDLLAILFIIIFTTSLYLDLNN